MGTRTYSRRGINGVRVPTALGLRTGRFASLRETTTFDSPLVYDVLEGGELHDLFKRATREIPADRRLRLLNVLGTPPDVPNKRAGQLLMEGAYKRQGFNGKPEVVSLDQFADMVRDNPQQFASLNGTQPAISARVVSRASNMDDLFEGETHHVPRQSGWFGTGTYFLTNLVTDPESPFQNVYPDTPEGLAAAISASFIRAGENYWRRIQEFFSTSGQSMQEWVSDSKNRLPGAMIAGIRADARTNFNVRNGDKQAFEDWVQGVEAEFRKKFGNPFGTETQRVTQDIGLMAAMLGYDAIYMPRIPTGSDDEIIVFNRSKLIVAEVARAKTPTESYKDVLNEPLQQLRNRLTGGA